MHSHFGPIIHPHTHPPSIQPPSYLSTNQLINPLANSSNHSNIYPLTQPPLIHLSLNHLSTHPPTHIYIHLLIHPSTHPPTHTSIHSPTHLYIHPLITHSYIHPLTHPLIHPPTHTSTYSYIHPLIHPPTDTSTHKPIHPVPSTHGPISTAGGIGCGAEEVTFRQGAHL